MWPMQVSMSLNTNRLLEEINIIAVISLEVEVSSYDHSNVACVSGIIFLYISLCVYVLLDLYDIYKNNESWPNNNYFCCDDPLWKYGPFEI